ncbi:hypothetical protein B0T18DRAFT_324749 [Schizothecium vesticola]|uniref:Tr-type G domain-containing protein n=1 Tax=Schizothecium vesticola TaxID=314040 RepID=A0AA40EV62_9PEZI|nr:hypothetical protein B0T18DRAFT_324749 [Schizothecium vesticola]
MSVFTFDPDPPRVSSPWLRPADPGKAPSPPPPSARRNSIETGPLIGYGITKLEAEPQDGPTEYKLHLLLRPRRKYERTSTPDRISGSVQSRPEGKSSRGTPVPGSVSQQTRQDRLEHLTTQLLWRLKQSCPHHSSSAASTLVVPQLPVDNLFSTSEPKLEKLLHGLEESRGALYEIGVADDGTLAGLTKDELDESLATLRLMAASLGCNMKVLRRVLVGDCEWIDSSDSDDSSLADVKNRRHQAQLWVAEALVSPDLQVRADPGNTIAPKTNNVSRWGEVEGRIDPKQGPLTTDQLRVTVTGPTTSGKSTLLGTLSTGTLDNGRGSSRLSLLKHLHEINSGQTSSVAQELVGYRENKVINYAFSGVESWHDIHDFTGTGRLVHLLDSAGHMKFRRTILRGIVGWAPHWTALCMAADGAESNSPGLGSTGPAGDGADLAFAHLDLCLKLQLPLAIVITKLDVATKPALLKTLNRVLTGIKKQGRTPMILKNGPAGPDDFTKVSQHDYNEAKKIMDAMAAKDDLLAIVPIVLTSAVNGKGIGLLHALLQTLPLPPGPTSRDYVGAALNPEQPACLFHIEDKFSLPASYAFATRRNGHEADTGTVVAGYLRFGNLSIGEKVVIGPFPPEDDESHGSTPDGRLTPGTACGLSLSTPPSNDLSRIAARSAMSASAIKGEWLTASIVSIRNLRYPVQTLAAGQVGSIGIVFDGAKGDEHRTGDPIPRIRKGMVLAVPSHHMVADHLSLQAASGLTAVVDDPAAASLTAGTLVNVYVASVRTTARVVRISSVDALDQGGELATEDIDEIFSLSEDANEDANREPAPVPGAGKVVQVQLELLSTREWIELGSRILLVEVGGGKDRTGLDGYAGKVVEIVE